MAITTLAGVEAGLTPVQILSKDISATSSTTTEVVTSFYSSGYPVAAAVPTPGVAGAALTSYEGQIPFTNPVSGNSYLAGLRRTFASTSSNNLQRTLLVVDRLWHNSGLSPTSTASQTVNSVTWPARDNNGSTNGEGVYIAIETSSSMGATPPSSVILEYTNSAGVTGKFAVVVFPIRNSATQGNWFPLSVVAGDLGVRSIQSIQLGSSWTAGTYHLVAYRPIAMINASAGAASYSADDALTLGMPRLWNNSVLQTMSIVSAAGVSDGGPILVQYTQG